MNEIYVNIYELIDKGKCNQARVELEKNENALDSGEYYYLMGLLFNNYKYPLSSKEEAKKYFGYAINSDTPIEDAFFKLVGLEHNVPHEIRILKKGIEHFPTSSSLYEWLLYRVDLEEIDDIFREIKSKGVESFGILTKKISVWFEKKYYNNLPKLIDVTHLYDLDNSTHMFFEILKGFAYIELNSLELSKKIFIDIVENDISHSLDYYQYFGLICCYIKENDFESAFKVLNELKEDIEIDLDMFVAYTQASDFGLDKYVLDSLSKLEEKTREKNVLGKIRGIRGLALTNVYSDYPNPKGISDIKYANKVFPHNVKYITKLKEHYSEKKKYVECLRYHLQIILNAVGTSKLDDDVSYIDDADEQSFLTIVREINEYLSEGNYIKKQVIQIIVTPIVERLFEEKQFNEIIKLGSLFGESILKESSDLTFNIAYSYHELDLVEKAEEYYLFYEKNFEASSAVFNNLGLIYEKTNQLLKARLYYQKAGQVSEKNKKALSNLDRINNLIQKRKEAEYKNIAKEISLSNLEKIGYTEDLLEAIKKISNKDLYLILARDIQETAIALLAGLNKMAVIMSGSINEALLLDIVTKKGITSYMLENGRKKDVVSMDLNELLYIIDKERLLDKQLYHFSHALRSFRNLIHPGVEQRKDAVITSEDAKIAWEIMKKIILSF